MADRDDATKRVQRVGAYVVCTDEARGLLLTRLSGRTAAPGWWTLPGGGVEFGESPEAAAIRELREETGLVGRLTGLLAVDSTYSPAGERFDFEYHAIRILYRCVALAGDLRDEPDGSSDRAAWFTRDELRDLPIVALGRLGMRLGLGSARPSAK